MVTQHGDRGWIRTNVPIDINLFITHPTHERLYHTTGVYADMIFWDGFPKTSSQPFNRNVLKANQMERTEFARLSLSETNFRNPHQSMKRQVFQISLAPYSLLIYLFIYCVFIKFLAFSRSTSGICGIACTNTTKKKEQYVLRHISSFFLFASL